MPPILLPLCLALAFFHLQPGCEARSLSSPTEMKDTSQKDSTDQCSCSDIECTCCSNLGPSKICNVIKIANNLVGTEEDLSLELSIQVADSKIFTQSISMQEMEPICYPYGEYNLCVQFHIKKNSKANGQVCGTLLAKSKGDHSKEETALLKSEIFCLQLGAQHLTNYILELLRLISQ